MNRIQTLALPVLLLLSPCAFAATYTVTTVSDSGAGSLRAAVASANAASGTDTIRFAPGLGGTIQLASEILIADSVAIEGPGPSQLSIAGSTSHRIFTLDRASGTRTTIVLSGLTFENGHASSGGAIDADDENLIVRNAVFRDNASVSRGGAIRLANGDLTLEDVTLLGNEAGPGNSNTGGAVYFSKGNLRMQRCLVQSNQAGYGGGLYLGTPAPDVMIEDSVFIDNASYYAGGAINAGTTMPSFHVARSSFIGNSSQQPMGSAIDYGGSTSPGTMPGVIENTTFSGNFTSHPNGRGIIPVKSGTLYLRNSTLAFNRTAADVIGSPTDGGAVWVGDATLYIDSTLFSHNTHGNAGMRVDIGPSSYSISIIHVSHSLLHATPLAGLISGTNIGNQFDTDAQLLPLAIEGTGFAPVHPIQLGSPAVDAGSNPVSLATDQRGPGYPRAVDLISCRAPSLARTDVGAYEYRTDTIFCNGFQS